MPRIRSLKPDFWGHPEPPSYPARLLYMAMWNWADDEGVGTANPKELAGFAFPYDDEMDAATIKVLLREVYVSYNVAFYTVGNRPYYCIQSWPSHQHPNNPSKGRYPKPDEAEKWLYQEEQDPDELSNIGLSEDYGRATTQELVVSNQKTVTSRDTSVTSTGGSGGTAKRGHRIPTDYDPPEDLKARMREKYPYIALGAVLADFRDYWQAETGSNTTKLSWDLTFQRRVRTVAANPKRYPEFHRSVNGREVSPIDRKAMGYQVRKQEIEREEAMQNQVIQGEIE